MNRPRLEGIIAATVLPMRPDFTLDEAALRSYLEWLLAEGVHGIAVNVDTGEGPHLSREEALGVLAVAVETAAGRVPVVAGLGPSWTAEAVAAAKAFRAAGADALLVFPSPAFRGRPLPPVLPVDYYRAVGQGADVPLILFQLQDALGGIEFDLETLRALAALPEVVAIKEASFDRARFSQTLAALGNAGLTVLTGNDNFIYESLAAGADGALIGFGTLAARMQVEMYAAHKAGDRQRAAALGERVQRLADVIFAPPVRNYRARLKLALHILGVIPCPAIRPPLPELSEPERERVEAALREAGLH